MRLFSPRETNSLNAQDAMIFAKMRIILALAALLVTIIDQIRSARPSLLLYSVLILFNLYAITLYIVKRQQIYISLGSYSPWIDIVGCVILLAASGGVDSVFYFFFMLPILGSSFRFGYNEGLRVTVACVLLYVIIGYFNWPLEQAIQVDRFFIRIVVLAAFGYVFSFLGGQELTSKSRLALLRDINKLSNPRFGVDQTLSYVLTKILDFFRADCAYLIMSEPDGSGYFLRQCDRDRPEVAAHPEPIDGEHSLLILGDKAAVCYNAGSRTRHVYSNNGPDKTPPVHDLELVADVLNVDSYLSVPLYRRDNPEGRIYLTSKRKTFKTSDAEFLQQVLQQAAAIVENIYLVDRLASEATERERQKIGRDIHDTTIQPYIGLKLGLEAIEIKQAASTNVGNDIRTLITMAEENISSIRRYISSLKDGKIVEHGNVLVSAIRQQAKKLSEFYGIEVDVSADDNLRINDRLSAEIFQIVAESLSNIRRHTNAKHGSITIECKDDKLCLEIRNDHDGQMVLDEFTPKSISGRAESLGGNARVQVNGDQTRVLVEIPI